MQNTEAKIIMHPCSIEELVKRKNVIYVKPYSMKELSVLYGVSRRTFYNWLIPFREEIGKRLGLYYSVKQVEIIFSNLGVPYCFEMKGLLDVA